MNQDYSVDNDLQQAIDNITNMTNIDPTFSDPVAAPSTIPEGGVDGLGEIVEPIAPEPIAPEPIAPEPAAVVEPTLSDEPLNDDFAFSPAPSPEEAKAEPAEKAVAGDLSAIKVSALRELMPLVDKLNIEASRKFRIFCDAYESLKDQSILEKANEIAKSLPDENERAEALLYIIDTIDRI